MKTPTQQQIVKGIAARIPSDDPKQAAVSATKNSEGKHFGFQIPVQAY